MRHLAPIVGLLAILPVFFVYADKWMVDSLKIFLMGHATISAVLKLVDPVCNFLFHGTTQITAATILFLIGRYLYRPLYLPGRQFLFILATSGLTVQIIKHLVGRARPRITDTFFAVGPSLMRGYDSFPSGHTTLAFSLAYILSSYYGRLSVVFYFIAMLAGFDRVKDGSHFPSDVIAGAFLGIAVAKLLMSRLNREGASDRAK